MSTFIALFRGINVGGNNILPMKPLTSLLESLGLRDVRTYIQSGNVVLTSDEDDAVVISGRIRDAVEKGFGFRPEILVMSYGDLERAARANPFPEAESEPRTLHLFFRATHAAEPDLEKMEELKAGNERYRVEEGVFYLHAPDGIGRSKLAARAEKLLGGPATARNWRTVDKLLELAGSPSN